MTNADVLNGQVTDPTAAPAPAPAARAGAGPRTGVDDGGGTPPQVDGTSTDGSRAGAPGATGTTPPPPPSRKAVFWATTAVGLWLAVLGVLTVVLTLRWWPVVQSTGTATVRTHGFALTASSGVLLLAIVGGSAGSLVHAITIFSSRVGRRTFEVSYLWWYLLRPVGAVLLALIFVTTVSSGLVALSGGDRASSAALAFVAGALAGLFSDAILQRLRGVLGATSTEEEASTQVVPLAPRPQPR